MSINYLNALTPVITLLLATGMVGLTAVRPGLWEEDGFIFILGSLLGSSSTASMTQKDSDQKDD